MTTDDESPTPGPGPADFRHPEELPVRDAEARARLMEGRSWNELLDRLRDAGMVIQRPLSPDTPLDKAEGYRYLARITRAALDTFLERNDPHHPELFRVVHETVKLGADNPNNVYQHATIDGDLEYVIRGFRGTVHYLTFATQEGHYGRAIGMPSSGFLDAQDLELGPDGSFEIRVSRKEQPGNWLPMTPASGTLIIRQTRLDWDREVLADLRVERVGPPVAPKPLTPEDVDEAFAFAGRMVAGGAMMFATWAEGFLEHVNELPRFDQELSNSLGGVKDIVYHHSYWRLAPGEALVVETPLVECDHWSFAIQNHWMESLDYRHHRIHLNSKTASPKPDGSLKLIVAHADPGHRNWIETAGHGHGTMCFRWVRPAGGDPPTPATRVVPLDDLRAEHDHAAAGGWGS